LKKPLPIAIGSGFYIKSKYQIWYDRKMLQKKDYEPLLRKGLWTVRVGFTKKSDFIENDLT
jgi:hypothetical protein